MSLEISKILFPSDLTGLSNTTIYITNLFENDVILKLRCNKPKRYHISRSEYSPNDDIFVLHPHGTISINVSVNLTRVAPNEKERITGLIKDRFQILYKEIPPLDSISLANLKELWEGIRKTGNPLEVIAECLVELPLEIPQNKVKPIPTFQPILSPSQPISITSKHPSTSSLEATIRSPIQPIAPSSNTGVSLKPLDKSSAETQESLQKAQPIVNVSPQSTSVSKQATKVRSKISPPFKKFKENLPLFIQEFQISDYEDVRLLSWKGFLVIMFAFLVGKLLG
jgi:hypothetical protein